MGMDEFVVRGVDAWISADGGRNYGQKEAGSLAGATIVRDKRSGRCSWSKGGFASLYRYLIPDVTISQLFTINITLQTRLTRLDSI